MIPILYDENETLFVSNGLGRLKDAISCEVTEERNGEYELEMEYSISGIHYSDIKISRIIFAQPADGKASQAFRIYQITKPINGIVTVYAEHISYQLNHIPVEPFSASNCPLALAGLRLHAAEDCPFEFWTDKGTDTSVYTQNIPSTIRRRLAGEEGSILQRYGGEYEWDNWTVKLWTHRGKDSGVTLRYGKNLTDLEQEESIASTYTGVMPYWNGSDDNGDSVLVMLPERVLHSEFSANYPYERTIPVDLTAEFENKPTEDALRSAGQAYMERNDIGVPNVNLRVSFVALWQTEEYASVSALERVSLCDTVHVVFDKLGVSAKAKVIKTVYDVLTERYRTIEIGNAKSSFTDSVVQQEQEIQDTIIGNVQSNMERALAKATNRITGGLGGYVVINQNADGLPNEILIMDSPDKETAVNVIRMNREGIGFSQDGYNGPFNSAWTIDGTMDMSQINVANLVADLIQGGTLILGSRENESAVIELYDENNTRIGVFDKNGIKMYGQDGSYVLINNEVGFAGFDKNNNKIYWVSKDEFHMKKSVIEEEITLCYRMRFIPITISSNGTIVNDGIGLVSVLEA